MALTQNPLFKHYKLFDGDKVADLSATAPSPSRDFHSMVVTSDKILWRWWRITSRNEGAKFHPGEIVVTYEDFPYDERIQAEIIRVFGQETLDYVTELVKGHLDLFPRLPKDLSCRIASYLALEDIARLSKVSRKMRKICKDNSLWERLYRRHSPSVLTADIIELGQSYGWKRLFFTNKLQLQRQLRRVRSARSARSEASSDQHDDSQLIQHLENDEDESISDDSFGFRSPTPTGDRAQF